MLCESEGYDDLACRTDGGVHVFASESLVTSKVRSELRGLPHGALSRGPRCACSERARVASGEIPRLRRYAPALGMT